MARNRTHGDHLTLQAATDIFKIEIVVYSTLGATATHTISPMNGCPIETFYLGHFAEGAGEHDMCLADETISDRSDTEYNCLSPFQDEQSEFGSTSGLNAPGVQSRAMQIKTLLKLIQRMVTEPYYMKMKSTIRITNVDMKSRETTATGESYPEIRSSEPSNTEYNCFPAACKNHAKIPQSFHLASEKVVSHLVITGILFSNEIRKTSLLLHRQPSSLFSPFPLAWLIEEKVYEARANIKAANLMQRNSVYGLRKKDVSI